jgi:hypothetical protein
MQKLLNTKERGDAFLKFLIFFMITVALIVTAVFYNYRVPRKENEVLLAEKDVMNIEKQNQDQFIAKMKDAMALRDTVKNMRLDNPYYETKSIELATATTELKSLSQTDGNFSVYNEAIARLMTELAATQNNYKRKEEEFNRQIAAKDAMINQLNDNDK